jgi:hypothetical protein
MEFDSCPGQVQEFLLELIRRRAFSYNSVKDKTLMNYLCTQKFDSDYINRSVKY